ncbi:site-specific recombinase, phage integrase family [Leptospirillum ferriphilum]|jgi:site-specific recombinase XerD|uniref:Site-specific recombinase, phage integrase family n=2 Tax=Leptospirillum TaxID=179 RepID=A0A094YPM0_9BACT|nr:tyrosine-type recombinase/integrase [Leptospirillum ferriphilum]EDZ39412.1 MAG: Integrase [Leptospirillum sp. Group II '5-way CG']KGA95201.1 site-specific recombinase, phage integrase family [Leptospirillum ferriphilum]
MARAKQDRGVFERPVDSGIWWVRYTWQGKEIRRKIGRKTDAKNYYARVRAQILEGRYEPEKPRVVTLGAWLGEYMETVTSVSLSQQRGYAKFWTNTLGGRPIASIKTAELERIQVSLREAGKLAPSTINRHFAFLKHTFNIALRDGLIKENPVKGVHFFKEPKGRTVFLSEADEAKLKESFSPEYWPYVELAIHTGLRQSEQFNLRWENIDMTSRVLTVPVSKSGLTRHVPLNDTALAVLRDLKARQVILSPWVFPSPVDHTKPRDGNAFYKKVFVPAIEKAGLSGVVWHTLRHTFCSRLVQAGVPLTTVQKLAGHKDYSTTLIYAHLSPDHLHEAVGILSGKNPKSESEPAPNPAPAPFFKTGISS